MSLSISFKINVDEIYSITITGDHFTVVRKA